MDACVGFDSSPMVSVVVPAGRPARPRDGMDQEFLRSVAWDVSQRKPAESFTPPGNHAALAMVNPCRGLAHWRIAHEWIEETRRRRAGDWHNCRMVLRLYDVSYITFNGLNANRIQDHPLPCICGQMFFQLPHAGTWQLGEVGFVLRTGEFIPAARSQTVSFPRASASSHGAQDALLVEEGLRCEPVGNLWDQEHFLKERRTPKLRHPLRIGILCMTPETTEPQAVLPEFITRLATGLGENGHEIHIVSPAGNGVSEIQTANGVHFHPIKIPPVGTPLEIAEQFRRAAEERIEELPPLDVLHVHEWQAGESLQRDESPSRGQSGTVPKICSFTSLEATRRNGTPPGGLSRSIEEAERRVASAADLVLVPGWLREKAVKELRLDSAHVHGFAMEGHVPNEWDCDLDYGQIKRDIGFGPMDRLLLFIGPLEHAAGPDLLLEALPTLLQRAGDLRLAFAGAGELHGGLEHRARQSGVEYAVRLLGHVDRDRLIRLLRASEALVLPSRYRVPFDDAVVNMARRAGRPVVTTHGGPAHLISHEETGIVTYDNPGSVVWALDRILGDPANAQRMGENGRRREDHSVSWGEVARRYLDLCAASFPQLNEMNH
jgi:glycogen synthase